MTVRSAVLARFISPSAGTFTLGTVPAGHLWLVKQYMVLNTGLATASAQLRWVSPDGTITCAIAVPQNVQAQGTGGAAFTFLALDAGTALQLVAGGAGMNIWVNGTDLLV